MPVEAAVSSDAPVMKAWEAYKQRDEFANTRRWALHEKHVDGSLWAAFYHGFFAASVNAAHAHPRPGDSWTTDEGVELVVVPKFATEVMIEAAHAAWKKPRMRLNYQPADDRNSVAVIINAAMLAAVEDDDGPR